MRAEDFPAELRELPRWVCAWKDRKLPMRADANFAASASDPGSWETFERARAAVELGYYDYVGFVFNGDGIIGIDIDDGWKEDGSLSDIADDMLERFDGTYIETSRSGRGFHILCRGVLPWDGANNRNGAEAYQKGRYFILTGNRISGAKILPMQEQIDWMVGKYFPETVRGHKGGNRVRVYNYKHGGMTEDGVFNMNLVYPPIGEGSRNISLASLAGKLHSEGYSKAFIRREVERCNREACRPPLPKGEVMQILRSVLRYER